MSDLSFKPFGTPTDFDHGENMSNINLLMDIQLRVVVELARTQMQLREVMELQEGSVIELDRLAGDPVDVYINDHLFAKGEVIVVDDNFGVRITQLIKVTR
jgi:flagellar motor switch protein FliN/FliY